MLILNLIYGALLIALGATGFLVAEEPAQIQGLALPGLTFGGGVLFCALYSLKEPSHGRVGAAFLGFLVFVTSVSTLLGRLTRGEFDPGHPAHGIGAGMCGVSLVFLVTCLLYWRKVRREHALAQLKAE